MSDKGILEVTKLPDAKFTALWESIILPEETKDQAINQILLELKLRAKLPSAQVPLHGLIVFVGAPGTGKTSFAKGVASCAATLMPKAGIKFLEVNPHSLTSSALGKSQREVSNFFQNTVAELAAQSPLIVLLDEVETLAPSRSRMSMEANPIDVHRATDAVLASLDSLACRFPELLFLATSNFEKAVDEALLSRADLILRFEKPTLEAVEAILEDTLTAFVTHWPKIGDLLERDTLRELSKQGLGLDGRQLRKAVLTAFSMDRELVMDPSRLTARHLKNALTLVKGVKHERSK